MILGIVYIQRKRKTGGKAFLSLDRGQGGGHNQPGAAWRFPGLSGGGHRWLPPNPLHLWHMAVGRHHTKPVVSGPRNARDEKHLVTGTDRMQPGANCDSTRSLPGFRGPLWWASTGWGNRRERERQKVHGLGRERAEEVRLVLATQVQGGVWARTIAKGQVLVQGPEVAEGPVLLSVAPVSTALF